jgi:hypothetical protein
MQRRRFRTTLAVLAALALPACDLTPEEQERWYRAAVVLQQSGYQMQQYGYQQQMINAMNRPRTSYCWGSYGGYVNCTTY